MRGIAARITFIVLSGIGSAWKLGTDDGLALSTQIWIMPAHHNSGQNVADFGLLFDDYPGTSAYDYSGNATTNTPAYIRGMSPITNAFAVRYWYLLAEDCRVRARMQRWVNNQWLTDYNHDVDILHIDTGTAMSGYTQSVSLPGQWFYAVTSYAGYCKTPDLHFHLGMRPSAYVSVRPKINDTCWANGSECSAMNGQSVGLHGPASTSCPGSRIGTTINRSGGTGSWPDYIPYKCQDWSIRWRSPDTPVFDAH